MGSLKCTKGMTSAGSRCGQAHCWSHTSVGLRGRLAEAASRGFRGGDGLCLEDGVDGVRDAAGSVDGFAVFYSEFDHAVVGPD